MMVSIAGVIFGVASPAAASEDATELLSCEPLPQAENAQLCHIRPMNAPALWFLVRDGEPLFLYIDTVGELTSVSISPSGRFLLVGSVGEGHPLLLVYSLERLLTDLEVEPLQMLDPYPGWISERGWEGDSLLVEANVPLDRDYERTDNYDDSPAYIFRWQGVSEYLERVREVEKQEVEDFPTIRFAEDSYTLLDSERAKLDRFAEEMKLTHSPYLTVVGHTDERGSDEYNLLLGERMAYSVRDYLVAKGVNPEQLKIMTRGESMPVDPGHDEQAWARNRRVEFLWEP